MISICTIGFLGWGRYLYLHKTQTYPCHTWKMKQWTWGLEPQTASLPKTVPLGLWAVTLMGEVKIQTGIGQSSFNKINPKNRLRGREDNTVARRRYKRCNAGGKTESGDPAAARSVILITMHEIRKKKYSSKNVPWQIFQCCNSVRYHVWKLTEYFEEGTIWNVSLTVSFYATKWNFTSITKEVCEIVMFVSLLWFKSVPNLRGELLQLFRKYVNLPMNTQVSAICRTLRSQLTLERRTAFPISPNIFIFSMPCLLASMLQAASDLYTNIFSHEFIFSIQ